MTAIGSSTYSLDVSQLTQLPMPKAIKLSDSEVAAMQQRMTEQYRVPVGPPDNAPENIYAQVKVNGKVVATLYNSGGAETSSSVDAQLHDLFASQTETGPQLAQTRAEQIAALVGGTIEKASTAQTQAQWMARPARQYYIDYAAMAADWPSRTLSSPTATSQLNAQLVAQSQQAAA